MLSTTAIRRAHGEWGETTIYAGDGTVRDVGWEGAAPNDPDRQDLLLVDASA